MYCQLQILIDKIKCLSIALEIHLKNISIYHVRFESRHIHTHTRARARPKTTMKRSSACWVVPTFSLPFPNVQCSMFSIRHSVTMTLIIIIIIYYGIISSIQFNSILLNLLIELESMCTFTRPFLCFRPHLYFIFDFKLDFNPHSCFQYYIYLQRCLLRSSFSWKQRK